jgi:hypothetical protein
LAFDLDDSKTRKRLQACASDPAKDFFAASSTTELAAAFDSIKNVVAAEIYISR